MTFQILSEIEKRQHEQVTEFFYPQVGLKMIVGIHSTALGPALGGCRMRLYDCEKQALDDVLRLSEGMTYKNSIAGLDLGGGKAVIIADSKMKAGRRELFLKAGECINNLGGRYLTAEDMGTSVADVMTMKENTEFVAGTALEDGGSGDPSPWTAEGVYHSIRAACERRYKSADLKGRHVVIQGAGHVGIYLTELLRNDGAEVTVADPDAAACEEAKAKHGADVVGVDAVYDVACDVFSPCAIGQTVNPDTISRLNCDIIAGAANNILTGPEMYNPINEKGILYCPDFVINSGGVISCAGGILPQGFDEGWVRDKVKAIYGTIHKVLDRAEEEDKFPEVVAIDLARERVESAQAA
jgi:leucine dehydrogenase